MASPCNGSASPSTSRKAATPCCRGQEPLRNYVLEYVQQINTGQVTVGRRIRRVYNRMADRIKAGHYKRWHFDLAKASRPIEFIEKFCRRSDGKHLGQQIQLDLWQKAFIQVTFGFVDQKGNRQFQEVFLLVGRKNGKTTLLSCLALYMLVADGEGAPEIYIAATKFKQAKKCYDAVIHAVAQSQSLLKHLKTKKGDELYNPSNFGKITPLPANSHTLDGLDSHMVVLDELHEWRDPELYNVLKQSISAREQPLVCVITTAGTVRESVFDNEYDYAAQIADEELEDDRFLPLLYELDNNDEWLDPSCWAKSNPGYGTIKQQSYLADMVHRAKQDEKQRRTVRCKDFNIKETETDAWLSFEVIDNPATFDISILKDCYGVGGVDLSATTDLTCATLLVRQKGIIYALQHYWIPAMVAEKKIREDKVPYNLWRDQGLMTFCDGAAVNYHDITKWFLEMRDTYGIYPIAIGYDPAYGSDHAGCAGLYGGGMGRKLDVSWAG